MENRLLFQVDRITDDGKTILNTYKIYTHGDIEGFERNDGSRLSISNNYPICVCIKEKLLVKRYKSPAYSKCQTFIFWLAVTYLLGLFCGFASISAFN